MSDNGHKRPSFLPEVRQFSQADPRIVQRPEGLTGIAGGEGIKPEDIFNDTVTKYAEMQASPGGWWEGEFYPAQAFNEGGISVLCDSPLGFNAKSVLIDNWTNQWLRIEAVRRNVPPYSGGWVFNIHAACQTMRVAVKVPNASYAPAAAIVSEYVWVGVSEAVLPPATGVITTVKTPVVV